MAVHSLKPATDRRLGGPLPRQQANQTRAHPVPPEFSLQHHAAPQAYAVLAAVSSCCPPVQGRLPTRYSPVRHSVHTIFPPKGSAGMSSFDLHVLGTPPAFILSQDQTLMFKFVCSAEISSCWHRFRFTKVVQKSAFYFSRAFSSKHVLMKTFLENLFSSGFTQ